MSYLMAFLIGLIASFLGSVPPGTLNLCVLQLGLEKRVGAAIRFALAVTIVEYPYAWIAIEFQTWVSSNPWVEQNFILLSSVVMLVMGIFSVLTARKPLGKISKFNQSGFRRGVLLSILNPMAIPFWIGITAFLNGNQILTLNTPGMVHSFALGTSVGVMLLLLVFTYLAVYVAPIAQRSKIINYIPGTVLLLLSVYGFFNYVRF